MEMTLLGSGGVTPAPRIGSKTSVTALAKNGGPDFRTGSSFFVHDAHLLFDTPEEVRFQLLRQSIDRIDAVILTHWHPDHTLGIRVLEQYNWDFVHKKPVREPIPVYISKQQLTWFKEYSCGGFLEFYQKKGFIKIIFFDSHDRLVFNDVTVEPILIEKTKGFYFVITDSQGKRVVYAPCEYHELVVDPSTRAVDILISHNLFWEDATISPRKIPPTDEDSFEQMLTHATEMEAERVIITHIEETFELSHEQMISVFKQKYPDFDVVPGYDGMRIEL